MKLLTEILMAFLSESLDFLFKKYRRKGLKVSSGGISEFPIKSSNSLINLITIYGNTYNILITLQYYVLITIYCKDILLNNFLHKDSRLYKMFIIEYTSGGQRYVTKNEYRVEN